MIWGNPGVMTSESLSAPRANTPLASGGGDRPMELAGQGLRRKYQNGVVQAIGALGGNEPFLDHQSSSSVIRHQWQSFAA